VTSLSRRSARSAFLEPAESWEGPQTDVADEGDDVNAITMDEVVLIPRSV
jgi:hypothetical protein